MKLIFLLTLCINLIFASFIKNGDIVIDTKTGLQWQDNIDVVNVVNSWENAIQYCENLTIEGYSDWRLPNIKELNSIVDRTKNDISIFDVFTNITSYAYWSSTTHIKDKNCAWNVRFKDGSTGWNLKESKTFVRCVRSDY